MQSKVVLQYSLQGNVEQYNRSGARNRPWRTFFVAEKHLLPGDKRVEPPQERSLSQTRRPSQPLCEGRWMAAQVSAASGMTNVPTTGKRWKEYYSSVPTGACDRRFSVGSTHRRNFLTAYLSKDSVHVPSCITVCKQIQIQIHVMQYHVISCIIFINLLIELYLFIQI